MKQYNVYLQFDGTLTIEAESEEDAQERAERLLWDSVRDTFSNFEVRECIVEWEYTTNVKSNAVSVSFHSVKQYRIFRWIRQGARWNGTTSRCLYSDTRTAMAM